MTEPIGQKLRRNDWLVGSFLRLVNRAAYDKYLADSKTAEAQKLSEKLAKLKE